MDRKQKQTMDSLVRVRSFIETQPATGTLTYGSAREMLDDVIRRLGEYASAQRLGLDQSRAEVLRQTDQIALLFDQHIRPIVAIARAQIEPQSDVGLPGALRLPKASLGPTKVLAVCDSMIEAARPYEALFIANGLPADFLAQFANARNVLERVRSGRADQVVAHTVARAGLQVQLRRGRRAVERLDSIVRASFRGDLTRLSAWRTAKRVHQIGGGAGPRETEGAAGVAGAPDPTPTPSAAGVPEAVPEALRAA